MSDSTLHVPHEGDKNQGRILEGKTRYEITLENDDVSARYEDSNENRFIAFLMVQNAYEELYNAQVAPGRPENKMTNKEMKDLQIARDFIKKHIAMLGGFVHNKYKDAVFTKDKPKIEIINPLTSAVPKDLKIKP